ncbi:MAG: cupin domain-containing protein [Pseudomonadales bacterium]|nr:cupin domain-containing protein [Pseudomonadales bacterium]
MTKLFNTLLALTVFAVTTSLHAADGPLLNFPLPALGDDKEVLVLEIDMEPGQSSPPHRHNAHVFVYVLEGVVNMQVAGGELQTLSVGEMFYENPDDIHAVSANASDTEPARILVHIIKTVGVPVSQQVSQ